MRTLRRKTETAGRRKGTDSGIMESGKDVAEHTPEDGHDNEKKDDHRREKTAENKKPRRHPFKHEFQDGDERQINIHQRDPA